MPCQYSLTRDFIRPPYSIIPENNISDHTDDWFSLKVLTPLGDVVLDIEIWESPFLFWVFARVVGPIRSSNEAQHKQSHEAQSDSIRCYVTHAHEEKLHERSRSTRPSDYPDIIFSPQSMHLSSFLVLFPSFHKSWDAISFKREGCNIPCYSFPNYLY
jgi:hypothetical protein